MKTSFYFVLWIIIYPILGLLNIDFINNFAFIIALISVIGINLLIKQSIPNTLRYDKAAYMMPIYEDIYTGNVASFIKRLRQDMLIEIVVALYMTVTTLLIGYSIFTLDADSRNWPSLIIFALFTFGRISLCLKYVNGYYKISTNPTPDECETVATRVYELYYASYYEKRKDATYSEMFPPRPSAYRVFIIASIILAVLSTIFGTIFIGLGINLSILGFTSSIGALALAGIHLLYGSLAFYYGIKDLSTCIRTK